MREYPIAYSADVVSCRRELFDDIPPLPTSRFDDQHAPDLNRKMTEPAECDLNWLSPCGHLIERLLEHLDQLE